MPRRSSRTPETPVLDPRPANVKVTAVAAPVRDTHGRFAAGAVDAFAHMVLVGHSVVMVVGPASVRFVIRSLSVRGLSGRST